MTGTTKLWGLHIPGPDDLWAMESEEAAHAEAKRHDNAVEEMRLAERFGLPPESLRARVVEWPHSEESHAASLGDWDAPDVMDTTNGNGIPDSLFIALQKQRKISNDA